MRLVRLTICIATLNRAAFIGATLESIVSQMTPEVELVVVDGASTDNTEAVVRSFAARCPRLRYVRLEKKGGVDQDYCKAVELAQGDYCWLFTDDDLLKPGAVAAVLEATRKNYNLIIVNAEAGNKDLTLCLQAKRINTGKDRVYSPQRPDWDHLLADSGGYLSYIAGVIIKRAVWNQREKAKYYGTLFVHMGVIFQSPLSGETLVMEHPWIKARCGNSQWTPQTFEVWMIKFPALIWSFPQLADWAKQRVEQREPWRNWQRLLMSRAMGHYSVQEYQRWLLPRLGNSPYRIFCRVVASTPVRPLNFLARQVVKYVFRKSPSMTLYELECWREASRT